MKNLEPWCPTGRRVFTQEQIAWVNEAQTAAQQNRRIAELVGYTSGDKLIGKMKWSCPSSDARAH